MSSCADFGAPLKSPIISAATANVVESSPPSSDQTEKVVDHKFTFGHVVVENQSNDLFSFSSLTQDDTNAMLHLESSTPSSSVIDVGGTFFRESRNAHPYSYDFATLPHPNTPELLMMGDARPRTRHQFTSTSPPNHQSNIPSPLPLFGDGFQRPSSSFNSPNSSRFPAELVQTGYPSTLPSPTLLEHLVEVFFACVPHASHLIHRPSFLASLVEPPTSPNFPSTALLHAICAMASLHTTVPGIRPIPEHRLHSMADIHIRPDHLEMEQGLASHKSGAFAAENAALARAMTEFDTRVGDKVLDTSRASVVLFWYYVRGSVQCVQN